MRSIGLRLAFWAIIPVAVTVIALVTSAYLMPNFVPGIVGLTVAYGMLVLSQFSSRRASSAILGLPLAGTAVVLFVAATIINVAVIWIPVPLWWLTIVLNVILIAAYLLLVIPIMLSNDQARALVEHQRIEVDSQHDLRTQVRALKLSTNNALVIGALDKLEEQIRYMPTASRNAAAPFDNAIRSGLQSLPSLLSLGDTEAALNTIAQIRSAVTERTNALKTGR